VKILAFDPGFANNGTGAVLCKSTDRLTVLKAAVHHSRDPLGEWVAALIADCDELVVELMPASMATDDSVSSCIAARAIQAGKRISWVSAMEWHKEATGVSKPDSARLRKALIAQGAGAVHDKLGFRVPRGQHVNAIDAFGLALAIHLQRKRIKAQALALKAMPPP